MPSKSDRTLVVVSHTHWDREWYQPFEEFRARLVRMMDSLLELLDSDPEYRHFVLDGQTVPLEVILSALKVAEDDGSTIVRVYNISNAPVEGRVRLRSDGRPSGRTPLGTVERVPERGERGAGNPRRWYRCAGHEAERDRDAEVSPIWRLMR